MKYSRTKNFCSHRSSSSGSLPCLLRQALSSVTSTCIWSDRALVHDYALYAYYQTICFWLHKSFCCSHNVIRKAEQYVPSRDEKVLFVVLLIAIPSPITKLHVLE